MKRNHIIMSCCLLSLPFLTGAFPGSVSETAAQTGTTGTPGPVTGYVTPAPARSTDYDPDFERYVKRGQSFAHCPDPAPSSVAPKSSGRKGTSKKSVARKKSATPALRTEPLFPDPICPPGCVPAPKPVSSLGTSERALPSGAPVVIYQNWGDTGAAQARSITPAPVPGNSVPHITGTANSSPAGTAPPMQEPPVAAAATIQDGPLTATPLPDPVSTPPAATSSEPAPAPGTGIPAPSAASLGQFSAPASPAVNVP